MNKTLSKVENDLAKVKDEKEFDIDLLAEQVVQESVKSLFGKYVTDDNKLGYNLYLVQKIKYTLKNTSFKNFFSSLSDTENDLIEEMEKFVKGKISNLYIDASSIEVTDGTGGAIIDLISQQLIKFEKESIKPFVMFIDEIHRYTKNSSLETSNFYSGLTSIAREGRKKGIFCFLPLKTPMM